jgi:O-antigen ligase
VVAAAGLVVGIAARDSGHAPASGATAERLASIESSRYEYWDVALSDGFGENPLKGVGAGGFGVIWLENRDLPEGAKQPDGAEEAHSLYVETLAELGIVGFAFLCMFLGGLVVIAVRARRVAPGAMAALVLWATHAAIDWDWQMPALTLVALVLAGYLVAAVESGEPRPAADPDSAADRGEPVPA